MILNPSIAEHGKDSVEPQKPVKPPKTVKPPKPEKSQKPLDPIELKIFEEIIAEYSKFVYYVNARDEFTFNYRMGDTRDEFTFDYYNEKLPPPHQSSSKVS